MRDHCTHDRLVMIRRYEGIDRHAVTLVAGNDETFGPDFDPELDVEYGEIESDEFSDILSYRLQCHDCGRLVWKTRVEEVNA